MHWAWVWSMRDDHYVMPSRRWLERYLDGHRDQVWHELRQLGSMVRDPGLAEEAQAVCDEMARRARHNVEVLVGRLTDEGYRFHAGYDPDLLLVPHVPPTDEIGRAHV